MAKEKNKIKKQINKQHLIIIISIVVVFLGIGSVGGYFAGKLLFPQQKSINYEILKDVDFEDDQDALMKKYSLTKTDDYTKNFKSYELANISTNKFKNHEFVQSKTYGIVNAMGVTQSVRASSIKNKNSFFLENISVSSMVQTGKRFYQSDGIVKTYNGTKIETGKAVWDANSSQDLTIEEHEAKWGKDLSRPLIYIISSKTTLDTSTSSKNLDGYTINLDLSPKYSVLRYVRQMVEISPVKDPYFHSIHLTLYLDNDLNLLKSEIEESYSVVMVVTAESNATIEETYTYDKEIEIPDLNQDLEY